MKAVEIAPAFPSLPSLQLLVLHLSLNFEKKELTKKITHIINKPYINDYNYLH